jgi:hypothetical protein
MLSSPVYVNTEPRSAEPHPRQPISRVRLNFFSFCPSQPSNLQTFQRANALSASRMLLRDAAFASRTQLRDAIQTLSNACHTRALLSREHSATLSPLAATLTDHRTSVANKRLTENLTPLYATLTKNRGEGCTLSFTPFHQIPPAPVFSFTYKLPILYPLCFDIHPCWIIYLTPLRHSVTLSLCLIPAQFRQYGASESCALSW